MAKSGTSLLCHADRLYNVDKSDYTSLQSDELSLHNLMDFKNIQQLAMMIGLATMISDWWCLLQADLSCASMGV